MLQGGILLEQLKQPRTEGHTSYRGPHCPPCLVALQCVPKPFPVSCSTKIPQSEGPPLQSGCCYPERDGREATPNINDLNQYFHETNRLRRYEE